MSQGFGYNLEPGTKNTDGTYANTLDSAVKRGFDALFTAQYDGVLEPGSKQWNEYHDNAWNVWKTQMYRDGHMDYAQAARMLYPRQEAAQTEFIKTLNAFTTLQRAIPGAIESAGNGPVGGVKGAVGRVLNAADPKAGQYDIVKNNFVQLMGGSPDEARQFDMIMYGTGSKEQKAKAILQRITEANTHQTDLLRTAGVLK